ncbi:EamA family transporter RarD [Knoellia sp. CPCC 206435]|uniref:EamA family transporter RarD n=1 Tax=Knoellia terrae TaxID=3404797 RepID=UPI0028811FE8|nr:EamA family transporter RarD [Rothia sp. ARF10]
MTTIETTGTKAGVLASVGASTIFAMIFALPGYLEPLSATQIFSYRILAMTTLLAGLFSAKRMWGEVRLLLQRLWAEPWLLGVMTVNASLLGVQIWLFGYAPQNGHGLDLSLGYLMLPLVMVLVSVTIFREALSCARLVAVLLAAAGVSAALFFAGGLGWSTVLVALGFPPYFVSRRVFTLNSAAAQLLELTVILPIAVLTLCLAPSFGLLAQRPELAGTLILLGVLSAAGFTLYLTASRVLPFALFGVLSYVEPILLLAVAVIMLGETLTGRDTAIYGPICAALIILGTEAVRARRASRSSPLTPQPPCTRDSQLADAGR